MMSGNPEIPRRIVHITEVARDTYHLEAEETDKSPAQEDAYLLIDDMIALIEPGSTATSSSLLRSLSELGFNLDNLAYIIPTHIHIDHGGGTGYLAQHLPKAKVVLHPKAVAHMIDPSRLIQSTHLAFGENAEKIYGPIFPVPENQIHVATDGEVIRLGKRELRIVFSPGHAPHHISILDSRTGGLSCGEALGIPLINMPNIILPAAAPPSFDLELYLESMEKLSNLSPRLLFYSHGGVRNDVENLIELAKENSRSFGHIIQSALEAGEGQEEILERISGYLKEHFPEVKLPMRSEITVSGYIGYFRSKKQ